MLVPRAAMTTALQPLEWVSSDQEKGMSSLRQSPTIQGQARLEDQLLLACSRTTVEDETAERVRAMLSEEIDWTYVVEKALDHRVTSLVYQSLASTYSISVPEDVLEELRQHTEENARYNLYRTSELIRLLRLLDKEGIPCFPFKGPVLSAQVYKNLALREYGDLDILIHPKNVLTTRDLFLSQGYKLWSPPNGIQKTAPFSRRNKDLILDSANNLVRVELHWRLTGAHFRFPLDMDRLWERLETTSLAGAAVRTLPLEDLLLYLCMHGSRHGWERLLWICDIAEIVHRHPEMDWQRVREGAHALGCDRMLGLGLLLARDLLGARLPEAEWQKIRIDQTVKSLAVQVRELLFRRSDASSGISYWNDLHLRVRERWRDRMRLRLYYYHRYLRLALVPNQKDRAILELPHALSSLYYLLRPFRLVKTAGLRTWKKLTKVF